MRTATAAIYTPCLEYKPLCGQPEPVRKDGAVTLVHFKKIWTAGATDKTRNTHSIANKKQCGHPEPLSKHLVLTKLTVKYNVDNHSC